MTAEASTRRDRIAAAYATPDKFLDRVALYRYQQPPARLPAWALEHVRFHDRDRVADVGCGPGIFVRLLRERPERLRITALDLSPGMVARAGGGIVGDVISLPLATGQIDCALAMHFLYHVPDIPAGVAELRRILRDDSGVLLVATNGRAHHERVPELIAEAVGVPSVPKPGGRFTLENGPAFLEPAFASVDLDVVRSQIVLDDPEPLVRFVASLGDMYAPLVPDGTAWDDVVRRVRDAVSTEIRHRGSFVMPTEAGVLVCRP